MKRPSNIQKFKPVDPKLGIKSSLPKSKSTIALVILLWLSNDKKYSKIEYKVIVMKIFDREFSGLSQEDVLKRQQLGKTHFVESKTTKTYKEIIFNNIFTLMYFCLLWIFNYLLFELFKIINDWYDENHHQTLKFMYHEHNYSISWMMYVIMAILLVIIQIVQLPTLFHIDAYLMFGFMILRSLKQIYKNRL